MELSLSLVNLSKMGIIVDEISNKFPFSQIVLMFLMNVYLRVQSAPNPYRCAGKRLNAYF